MKYDWYYFWCVLFNEAEKVVLGDDNFENARAIKKIQLIFEKMSTIYLKEFSRYDLSKMWVNYDVNCLGNNLNEKLQHFAGYIQYASDRMNLNRWLYAKLVINNMFDEAYSKIDAHRWYEECVKWEGAGDYKDLIEKEMDKWFEKNFDNLYLELVKKEED